MVIIAFHAAFYYFSLFFFMKFLPYVYPALIVFMLPLISGCYAYNGLNKYYYVENMPRPAGW